MIQVLFPLGVRLSTLLTAAVFVGLAWRWRDSRVLLAAFAWIAGFELVFQVISIILDRLPLGVAGPVFFIILGVIVVARSIRVGVVPNWWLIAASGVVLVVWAATGFHLNGHQHGMFSLHTRIAHFDPWAEVLNEASKTLWALAYLLPLLAGSAGYSLRASRGTTRTIRAMIR